MSFDVTVLGSAGTHPGPGRACSGYLFRADGTQVLVDAGNGSTCNLQEVTAFERLDAVIVTHRHADHSIDLIGMYYALKFHDDGPQTVDLYAPTSVMTHLTAFLSEDTAFQFGDVFRHHPLEPGDRMEFGPMVVDAFDANHPVPTVSVRVSCEGKVATYSSDTAGNDALVEAARDSDLFLCEATWLGPPQDLPPGVHLTGAQAGEYATRAGAKRLVLTHLWPANDPADSLEEASRTFRGNLSLAEDRQVWNLT